MDLKNGIRWMAEPAPWRGFKVMAGAGLVFGVSVMLAFVLSPSLRPLVMVLGLVAWTIGAIGMLGHYRWWAKRGREGKVGFNDQ